MGKLCKSDFGSMCTCGLDIVGMESSVMIKVFTGNVYTIQESEYDRDSLLEFFLDGHREEYILVYRGERLQKVLSYYDVLFQRDVPETVLYMDQDIFKEARKIFFSYERREDRWNRAAAVCNRQEEIECILYYQQNRSNYNYTVSEFEDYQLDDDLDFELLSWADNYVFEEYEEYTAFISSVLKDKFPGKKILFVDENAVLFGMERCDSTCSNDGRVMHVTSNYKENYFAQRYVENIYSSLDIMTALFWQKKQVSYGECNPDKKFMLIRFPLQSSGLGDVIRFCMSKVATVEYRNLDYIPVIDLSVPDDGNQFSGGRQENVWEYYFEPLNECRIEEVRQSKHVLLCDDKMDAYNPYIAKQYFNTSHMRAVCRKYLKLNRKMADYVNQMKQQVFPAGKEKMLGVIARGTDYRYGGFDDLPIPMEDDAYIETVRKKMKEWDCTFLLLATEDADILEKFQNAGFGEKLKFLDQERYRYTEVNKPGILIVHMQKDTHNYQDEMPYLAVLYLLAECQALISNCRCGAFEVADFMNGDAYEHRYCWGEMEGWND